MDGWIDLWEDFSGWLARNQVRVCLIGMGAVGAIAIFPGLIESSNRLGESMKRQTDAISESSRKIDEAAAQGAHRCQSLQGAPEAPFLIGQQLFDPESIANRSPEHCPPGWAVNKRSLAVLDSRGVVIETVHVSRNSEIAKQFQGLVEQVEQNRTGNVGTGVR